MSTSAIDSASDNYGYRANLITCSADRSILRMPLAPGHSFIYRPGIDPRITEYFEKAIASPDQAYRLGKLHGIRLSIHISCTDRITVRPMDKLTSFQLCERELSGRPQPLGKVFPGPNGDAVANKLEDLVRVARDRSGPDNLAMRFWTQSMHPERLAPHVDPCDVIGTTLFGPCTYMVGAGHVQHGDISLIRCAHIEGTSLTGGLRFWAGVFDMSHFESSRRRIFKFGFGS